MVLFILWLIVGVNLTAPVNEFAHKGESGCRMAGWFQTRLSCGGCGCRDGRVASVHAAQRNSQLPDPSRCPIQKGVYSHPKLNVCFFTSAGEGVGPAAAGHGHCCAPLAAAPPARLGAAGPKRGSRRCRSNSAGSAGSSSSSRGASSSSPSASSSRGCRAGCQAAGDRSEADLNRWG